MTKTVPATAPESGVEDLHLSARQFCPDGVDPFATVQWTTVDVLIKHHKTGEVVFSQPGVEAPASWSQNAVQTAAHKYFCKNVPALPAGRETSVRQLIARVADTLADAGLRSNHFRSAAERDAFRDDLVWLLLHQHGAFNSPVWFNVGLHAKYGMVSTSGADAYRFDRSEGVVVPVDGLVHYQGSACFIHTVGDSIAGIMKFCTEAAQLFKYGSGSGGSWSTLRSAIEPLARGGHSSGPMSFLGIDDSVGGAIQSGGTTRRAAIMATMDDWHPDILQFAGAKDEEDKKARALIAAGWSADFTDPAGAYASVKYQNMNMSARLSDQYMEAYRTDAPWTTRWVTDRTKAGPAFPARRLLRTIAQGTWGCGDPGTQYSSTIAKWHTVPNTAPINSSNPCSEYMHIDDSACNLASLRLTKFLSKAGKFLVGRYRAAVRVFITAQELLVEWAGYPTAAIARNSHRLRPLGLGYADLGSLLMRSGLAYDSPAGRWLCAAVTSLTTAEAYRTSALWAARVGAFEEFEKNRGPMLNVIGMHRDAHVDLVLGTNADADVPAVLDTRDLAQAGLEAWNDACRLGARHGFRNSQATVLAPTGTISFLMDCDTTGIEPELGLVKFKRLVGGGTLKLVNEACPAALRRLGYDEPTVQSIAAYISENGYAEGAPWLEERHLPVFDTSFAAGPSRRHIAWRGHLLMMAAAQPFISGAISKTVNMPEQSTVDDIEAAYVEAHRLGLKAVAIYRDNCKASQPLTTAPAPVKEEAPAKDAPVAAPRPAAVRVTLPATRRGLTHKFDLDGHRVYLRTGEYADGTLGEVFLTLAKEGSTLAGFGSAVGILASLGLQHGVPLSTMVKQMAFTSFEPRGMVADPDIRFAHSMLDYVFRWLAKTYGDTQAAAARVGRDPEPPAKAEEVVELVLVGNGPPCVTCGGITKRTGKCFTCTNCHGTSGCG